MHRSDRGISAAHPSPLCAAATLLAAVALFALSTGASHAEFKVTTSATGEYLDSTNVFDLPSGLVLPGIPPGKRGDTDYAYGAALNVDDNIGLQDLFVHVSGRELRYDFFRFLDHDEYNLDGGLKWKIHDDADGQVDVSRTRTMVAFYDLTPGQQIELQLPVQTEQRETANAGLAVTPDLRVEAGAYHRVDDQPLIETPHLQLTETEGSLAVKWIGRALLTSGVKVTYAAGHFAGGTALNNPAYDQTAIDLTAKYTPSGRSTLEGELGYSHRSSAIATNDLSGITGKLDYHNQLTGRSAVEAILSRGINSFIAGSGAEIETLGSVNLSYQITFKIGAAFYYSYTDRNYPNQGALPGTSRTDHQQDVSLRLDYEIRRWLSIKPYATYETRASAFNNASFNAAIYGISVIVHSIY